MTAKNCTTEDRRRYDERLSAVDTDLKKLGGKYHILSSDVGILQHLVKGQVANSVEWHTRHDEQMRSFEKKLSSHMDDESEELALILAPIVTRLTDMRENIAGLYARFWTAAIGVIMILLSTVGYLYHENQKSNQRFDMITEATEQWKK